jgi:hypothetical protein
LSGKEMQAMFPLKILFHFFLMLLSCFHFFFMAF